MAPSPEVSRTALIGETKSLGITISSDVIWHGSGGWKILEHGSFTHGVTTKPKKNNATIQGKSPPKIYHTHLHQVWIPPKKMSNFSWSRTSHPPVFKKNTYSSQPGGDWKLSWKKKTWTIQKLQSWSAAVVLVGTWEQDPLVASSKKGVSPQHATRWNLPNKKASDHKTICKIQQRRASFVFFHIAQAQNMIIEWNMSNYLEYIFQPSSQCLSESQKQYTSTKLSAGGMPVSFSGSDLGRQKKSHQAFEVLFKKMMICIFTNKHSFKKISTPGLQDFLSFTNSKGVFFPEETPFGTRWIFPHFGPCP